MSYVSGIPQGTDDPKISQGQLLSNFGKINSDYMQDHVALTSSSNSGFHKKVTLQDVLPGDPGLPEPLSSVDTKTRAAKPELFFQRDNVAATDVMQLTNLPGVVSTTNYSIITPWNIMIKMGLSGGSPISFAGPAFSAPPTLFLGLTGVTASNPRVTSASTTQLIYTPFANSVYYLVLGLP